MIEVITVSIEMSEEEARIFEDYAKHHNVSVSDAMKSTLSEKIEDEFDAVDLIDDVARFEKEHKIHSLEELRKENML